MIAVIMAGGEGSRLRPVTCDRPKPLVPVCNRPVLRYTLDLLAAHGFQEVFFTLGYMPQAIQQTFGDRYGPLRLRYVVEESPRGTAGGVAALRDRLDRRFLVISGDGLTDISLSDLIRFHDESRALATLALHRVERPLDYGVVLTDRVGRVRRFLEKPGWGEVFSDTVNTGIYVLEPSVLAGVPPGRVYDFSQHLFPALLQAGGPLFARVVEGYWCDVGETETYLQANLDLLSGRLLHRPPGREVAPGVWVEGEPPQGVTVEGPALVGEGCRLAPGATLEAGVILGPGTHVGPGAVLRRSITGAGVWVGAEATLVGAVACDGAQIGERSGLYSGAVVGPGAVLDQDVTVAPGVRIWQGVQVAAGVRVESSLAGTERFEGVTLRAGALRGRPGQELLPEAAMRLGMAFGAVVEGSGPLMVGADPAPAARLLAQVITCGAQAVGRPVLDLGETASPVTAFAIGEWGAVGGIHICFDGAVARVVLHDGLGRPACRRLQRRVEQVISRQEFQRAQCGMAGTLERLEGAEERYLAWLARRCDQRLIRAAGIAVESMGARWSVLERWLPRPEPSSLLVRVRIDPLEATWHLEGATQDQMLALELLLQGRMLRSGGVLNIPVQATRGLEWWLNRAGYETVRIRQSDWQPVDPLLAIGSLVAWMGEERMSPEEVLAALPEVYTAEAVVDCPWEAKGRVMRALLEEHDDDVLELIDGLRIRLPTGSALLLPDPDEPVYRVLAEGEEPEAATALAERYATRVRELLGEPGGGS